MSLGHGASIVRDGLIFAYDMGPNPGANKSWKGAPTTNLQLPNVADWTNTAVVTLLSEISPIKTPVYSITDNNSGSYLSSIRNITVPNDSNTYTISIYIKKTFGATSARLGFNCGFTGGTPVQFFPRFNSDTGIGNTGSSDDLGFWWRWKFSMTNNSTGNTTLYCQFYPATGFYNSSDNAAATGTATVSSVQIEQSTFATPFVNGTRSNTQALLDWTGNNTITANSLTYNNGGTFSFNGTSDYLNAGNSTAVQITGSITMEAWVNPVATTNFGNIISKNFNSGYRFRIQSGQLWWYVSGNAVAGGSVPNNTWSHCVVTGSASGLKAYVNGVLVASNSTAFAPSAPTVGNLFVGTFNPPSTELFDGTISLAKIYNRALTAAEVSQNFNALRGRYGI
jgi:hypothetical protein